MYKSPIEAIQTDIRLQYEGEILKAVQNCNIIIDKKNCSKPCSMTEINTVKDMTMQWRQ